MQVASIVGWMIWAKAPIRKKFYANRLHLGRFVEGLKLISTTSRMLISVVAYTVANKRCTESSSIEHYLNVAGEQQLSSTTWLWMQSMDDRPLGCLSGDDASVEVRLEAKLAKKSAEVSDQLNSGGVFLL